MPAREKYLSEYLYWQRAWISGGGSFQKAHYPGLMLAMAGEADEAFLQDKVVADFGCGPCESLWWAKSARLRIGIDVVADRYSEFNISSHQMCYVISTEQGIPLPSNYVDFMFTLNAMDHVQNLEVICHELIRTLKPGGEFIGSFNLGEPASTTEPQTLTEDKIKDCLLQHLEVVSYRLAPQDESLGGHGHSYRYFFEPIPEGLKTDRQFLWVRARKRR